MGDKTGIEWTDATWNPTTGCDRVSPGCDHCYAMTLAPRLKAMGSPRYQTDGDPVTSGPGFGFAMHPDALDQPLRWTRPRRVFVNSMSDLFHSDMDRLFLTQVFAVMSIAHHHTFQILTKRPGAMRSILSDRGFRVRVHDWAWLMVHGEWGVKVPEPLATAYKARVRDAITRGNASMWPLPNVWLGTSVEDQKRADLRIPPLLDTPAAVRFLSCEPLLGPVNLRSWLWEGYAQRTDYGTGVEYGAAPSQEIDWVIVGGESGKGARPMLPDWARSLRDQCVEAGVPFLFKQFGSHDEHGTRMDKKKAGRLLDGRTWDEYPEVVTT